MVFCSSIWAFVFHRFRYLLPSSARQAFAKASVYTRRQKKIGSTCSERHKIPGACQWSSGVCIDLKAHFFSGFLEIKRKYFGIWFCSFWCGACNVIVAKCKYYCVSIVCGRSFVNILAASLLECLSRSRTAIFFEENKQRERKKKASLELFR